MWKTFTVAKTFSKKKLTFTPYTGSRIFVGNFYAVNSICMDVRKHEFLKRTFQWRLTIFQPASQSDYGNKLVTIVWRSKMFLRIFFNRNTHRSKYGTFILMGGEGG